MLHLLVLGLVNTRGTHAALALSGQRCGSKVCDLLKYCSTYHNQCENCETICEKNSHNFDQDTCSSQCQVYLHDLRYTKSSDYAVDIQRLQKTQLIILVILIILLILFIIIHGTHFVRWLRKKDYLSFIKRIKEKKDPRPEPERTHENPYTESPKMTQRNGKASTVFSVSGNEGSVHTTSTPLSKRYPAEDTTLDYSYDNGALQITPNTEKPKTETTF